MKDAYKFFDKVINEATNAYNLLDQKDISINDFQGCLQAVQLLIFANIATISFDKKNECFLLETRQPALSAPQLAIAAVHVEKHQQKTTQDRGHSSIILYPIDS